MGSQELDDGSTPPIRLRQRLADHVQAEADGQRRLDA
jgi:hypothetical protein